MHRMIDRRPKSASRSRGSVLLLLNVLLVLLATPSSARAQQLALRTPAERGGRALAFAPDGRLGELVREVWMDAAGAFHSVKLRYRERPAASGGVAATENDPTRVRISWLPTGGATLLGYAVFRQLPGGDPEEIAFVSSAATTADDTTIAIGVTAIFTVRARTAAGLTAPSPGDAGLRPVSLAGASSGDAPAGSPSNAFEVADRTAGGTASLDGGRGSESAGGTVGDGSGPVGGSGGKPGPVVGADEEEGCAETIDRIERLLAGEHESTWPGRVDLQTGLARLLETDPAAGDPRPVACRMRSGDATLDGRVDGEDLAAFLVAASIGDPIAGDLDRDGAIDAKDLDLVLSGMLGTGLTDAGPPAPARIPRGP